MAGMSRDFRIEVPSPLRDGGVYRPDPPRPGVLPAINLHHRVRGILTACPSATPLGLALGPD